MKRKHLLLVAMLMASFSFSSAYAQYIMFLTNQADNSNQADATVIEAMEDAGYEVQIKVSSYFDPSADLDGVDLIFLAEAISSGDPAMLYTAEQAGEIGIGLINCEPYAYTSARLPWYGDASVGSTTFGSIFVTEEGAAHEIMVNADLTEVTATEEDAVQVLEQVDETGDACNMAWVLASDVTAGTLIATDGGEIPKALVTAIEKGTECSTGYVTTGRRAHYFMANKSNNQLTDEGADLLISMIEWCIEGNNLEVGEAGIKESTVAECKYANNTLVVEQEASIEIFAISGELCASQSNVTSYDCSSLSKGIYIARVITTNGNASVCKISVK